MKPGELVTSTDDDGKVVVGRVIRSEDYSEGGLGGGSWTAIYVDWVIPGLTSQV